MGSDVRDIFIREGAARELWREGDAIAVAVSGGPDSMALLHLFHSISGEQSLRLLAAHVNHGFRGAESERELRVVRDYCLSLGVPCETVTLDMPTYIEENRLNLQAAARVKRYEFLREAAARHEARTIALAHHADDQAETVLMRLIRGAGPAGLSGMADKRREKNMELIRPLLRMNKSDLVRYCEEGNIPYCTDSSNLERYYFRNTVRLDILPYLSQYNPQLSLSLQRLAEVAGAEEDYMDARAKESFSRIVSAGPGEYTVSCKALTGIHVALQRRLIKLILSYLSLETENISFEGVERMRLAAMPGAPSTWRTDVGGDLVCIREYGQMRWLKKGDAEPRASGYNYSIASGQTFLEAAPSGWSFRLQWPRESGMHGSEAHEAAGSIRAGCEHATPEGEESRSADMAGPSAVGTSGPKQADAANPAIDAVDGLRRTDMVGPSAVGTSGPKQADAANPAIDAVDGPRRTDITGPPAVGRNHPDTASLAAAGAGRSALDGSEGDVADRPHWPPQNGPCRPSSRYEACFDVTRLALPLTVRSRLPGDRIQVLGLNGSKKVQDMFVDEKVPPSRRELYPLLCDAEGRLLWIPGIRRSAHAPAGANGSGLLYIAAYNETRNE